MSARSIDEPHRSASQLELLFDLTFVVAVAAVTQALLHHVASDHPLTGVVPYLMVFFAIWWAWMNFTWFASSYDTDDVVYRLLTFVQMAGVLVLAAGVPAADTGDFRVVTLGYLIMRLGLITLWWRASREDPAGRVTARRYVMGLSVAEFGWLSRLALDENVDLSDAHMRIIFLALVAFELAVPPWAERHRPTSWHPHHIAERYGLFVIILLGEGVFAASTAVNSVLAEGRPTRSSSSWQLQGWSWCGRCGGCTSSNRAPTGWREGATGRIGGGTATTDCSRRWPRSAAGLELAVEHTVDSAIGSPLVVGQAIAIPVSVFLMLRWAVNRSLVPGSSTRPSLAFVPAIGIVLLGSTAPIVGPAFVVCAIAAVTAGTVAASVVAQCDAQPPM